MTTPTPGGQQVTPPADTIAPFTGALVPIPTDAIPGIPTPADVKRLLTSRVNEAIGDIRKTRVAIKPDDYFAAIREVNAFRDLLLAYSTAFTAVAKVLLQIIEEELFDAVGEQDGIPNSGLDVPDIDGTTVKVKVKTSNVHAVDPSQVLGPLATMIADRWAAAFEADPAVALTPAEAPEQYAIQVAEEALSLMGKADMKVTLVRELARQLGTLGEDALASTVKDAIRTTRKFDGIGVERKSA